MKNIINFRLFVLLISITNISSVYPAEIIRIDTMNPSGITISTIPTPTIPNYSNPSGNTISFGGPENDPLYYSKEIIKVISETTKGSGNESLIFESIWKMSTILSFIGGFQFNYPELIIKNIQKKGVTYGLLIPAIIILDGLYVGKCYDLTELFFPTIHGLNPHIGKFFYDDFSISFQDFNINRENFEREQRDRFGDEYERKRELSTYSRDSKGIDYHTGKIFATPYALNPSISSFKINDDSYFCHENCFSDFKIGEFLVNIGFDFSDRPISNHLTADTKNITLENYKNWGRKYFPHPRGGHNYSFPDPKYPAAPYSWVPPMETPVENIENPLPSFQNVCERGEIGEYITSITNSESCEKVAAESMAKILEINLSNKNINKIQSGAFIGLVSVRKIILANNNLSSISSDAFTGPNNLKEIDLSSNQLNDIPDNAFQKFPHLCSLNLANNLIEKVSSKAFKGLEELETLTLQSNKINEISVGAFEDFYSLQVLDVRNNLIKSLDRVRSELGNAVTIEE